MRRGRRRCAADAFRPQLGGVFSGPDKVRQAAVETAVKLGVKEVSPVLAETVADGKRPTRSRVEALRALGVLKDSHLDAAVKAALADAAPAMRAEGRRLLAAKDPAAALPLLEKTLDSGEVIERQQAYAVLGGLRAPGVDDLLTKQMDKLLEKKLPPEVTLDLLEAAGRRCGTGREGSAGAVRCGPAEGRPAGGVPRGGVRRRRRERAGASSSTKTETSCLRCHKINGEGGEVGPELKDIGAKQNRDYILESIVDPNKQIAKGYESVLLILNNGQTRTGVLKGEDAKEIRLMTAEGKLVVVAKSDVDERHPGKSAMPEDIIKKLSKSELRDLVEFLSGLKEK